MSEAKFIDLRDGRRLAFSEFGDLDGLPVIYHHGGPASHLEAQMLGKAPHQGGVRLIAVDRPGIGQSPAHSDWTFLSFAEDVRQLADHLGIDKFGVLGWSAGGPPALACAYVMPERLTTVVSVAGAPFGTLDRAEVLAGMNRADKTGARIGWAAPWAMTLMLAPIGWSVRLFPNRFMKSVEKRLCPADQSILSDPQLKKLHIDSLRDAFRQGARGPSRDAVLDYRSWGFDVGDIKAPVTIWQGTADTLVNVDLQQSLADQIPGANLTLFPGEGHYLLIPRAEELMELFAERPSTG